MKLIVFLFDVIGCKSGSCKMDVLWKPRFVTN
jgi:hypothetical protein